MWVMPDISYDTVETLLYDPVPANRALTRSMLYELGFRRIEAVGNLPAVAECMQQRPPHLALCEAHGEGSGLFAMIQNLRQGFAGYNPFVVIVVTTWKQHSAHVTRVLDSGADDLMLRPFSAAILGQRLRTLVERRKGFVVTSEYVGPDRRRNSKRSSDVQPFDPPNSLRMTAQERLTPEDMAQRLDGDLKEARRVLAVEKLRRDAFHICVLWWLMRGDAPEADKYEVDLVKLRQVAKGMAHHCKEAENATAAGWCDSILAAIGKIDDCVKHDEPLQLLGHAALNLNQLLSPEKSNADHLSAIKATAVIIKARIQPALAS